MTHTHYLTLFNVITMASFRIQEELKVKPKPTQQAPQANPLNSWMQFWSMIENTFKGKKGDWQNPLKIIKGLAEGYAGKDRLKMYNEILGK